MIVLFAGGFDLLHVGHVAALRAVKDIAGPDGRLIVGVNSDTFMEAYKRVPNRTQARRLADVAATGLPDSVVLWNGPEGQDEQILSHTPDLYAAGTDWLTNDLARQLGLRDLGWFADHNISLMFLRRTPGISTTQLTP